MIRRVLACLGLGAGWVLVACSSDTAADKYPSVDSFCDAKAAAECAVAASPCRVADATCKSARVAACKIFAAAAGGRTYTPSRAENCIQKTNDVYKDRLIDPVKEKAYNEACQQVFAGSKKKNDTCGALYDCEGSLTCDIDKGFCAVEVQKQAGDGCNNPGDICVTGLYCQKNGAASFCGKKKGLGDTCGAKDPCSDDLRCLDTKCQPKVIDGGTCVESADCGSGFCDASDPAKKQCFKKQYASETGTCRDFGGS